LPNTNIKVHLPGFKNIQSKSVLSNWASVLDISYIHNKFGSPTYIVSETQLENNLNEFLDFTKAPEKILFPVKANPALTVLQILAKLGAGADCANYTEINLALYAGFKIQNISYNSPAQDVNLCLKLLEKGATVVMDDCDAIKQLQKLLINTTLKGKIVLRINLQNEVKYHTANHNQELMAHSHHSSKFGIPAEDLLEFLKTISLPITGLHTHVGTQMDNLISFQSAMVELRQLADKIESLGFNIKDINLGGGLGIPFSEYDSFPTIQDFCSALNPLKQNKFNYYIEPGHALVGNAVALLTEILTIKNSRGKKWAITDVGTDQLAKITLLKWPHRILDSNGVALMPGADAVAGPLCFSGDTLLDNVNIDSLNKHQAILVTEAGAYTYSLENKFNGRLAPAWVVIDRNLNITPAMLRENVHGIPQLALHLWNPPNNNDSSSEILHQSAINNLSSKYLSERIVNDSFNYIHASKENHNAYKFSVNVTSEVGFISMPLAIRIFGDASIIALLHNKGFDKKEIDIWGRKLTLDCFEIIPAHEILTFTINQSEVIKGSSNSVVSRFNSVCNRCSGNFILKF
jgi:diaminopimelate decarboxylase